MSAIAPEITAEFDSGDFKVGDRVRLTAKAKDVRHVGATGRVVRVESNDPADGMPVIYPVAVWLDVFGAPTDIEANNGLGLPVCAMEIEKVGK